MFLRRDDAVFRKWLNEALAFDLPLVHIRFDNEKSTRRVSFFDENKGIKGLLAIDKMSYEGIGEEEHLVFSVITHNGISMDEDLINRMLELPATIVNSEITGIENLNEQRKENLAAQQIEIENNNKQYYLEECEKLDAYSEELKDGLEREISDMRKLITVKRKEFKSSTNLPLDEMLQLKDEINTLEKKRKEKQRHLYEQQDRIDEENERLQEEIRKKLKGKIVVSPIMTISFEID